MQLSLAFVLLCGSVVIDGAMSAPAVSVPILSHLMDAPNARGFRQPAQFFRLPLRQPFSFDQFGQAQPSNIKQQKQQQQEVRPNLYFGVPLEIAEPTTPTTEFAEEPTTTTEMPATTEVTFDELKEQKQGQTAASRLNDDAEKFDQEGIYYIYHPDGLLQRVVYGTRIEDMGYTARLTYKDVEPIKDPIYTYDPRTLEFSKVYF